MSDRGPFTEEIFRSLLQRIERTRGIDGVLAEIDAAARDGVDLRERIRRAHEAYRAAGIDFLTEAIDFNEARRAALEALGQRAVDYYVDTGLCVFCGADDVAAIPHDDGEDGCDVGEVAGVAVTPERRALKARQREFVNAALAHNAALGRNDNAGRT